MGAISAGRRSIAAVIRNPILVLVAAVFGLVQLPQLVVQSAGSNAVVIASGLLSLAFVLLYPFFFGGIIGMGDEAITGKTSLGAFVRAGKANYVPLFGAYLLLMVLGVAYVVALFVVGAIGGIAVFSVGGDVLGGILFPGFMLVAVLLYFLLLFFVQFFGQAIVLDDVGSIGGFRRSIGVVRGHKLSTLGYTLVVAVVGGVFGVLGAVFGLLGTPSVAGGVRPSIGVLVGAAAVFVVLSGVVGAFSMTYGVAFYRDIRPTESSASS